MSVISKPKESLDTTLSFNRNLVLYNDDVNTFDYVIEVLMNVCDYTFEQATQCTYIVHFKGKCCVKKGNYAELKKMCLQLLDASLSAKII